MLNKAAKKIEETNTAAILKENLDFSVWTRDKDNPNIFSSNKLELIHCHEDYIYYWEDYRVESTVGVEKISFYFLQSIFVKNNND